MEIDVEKYNYFINNLELLDISLNNINAKKYIDDTINLQSDVVCSYVCEDKEYNNNILICKPKLTLEFKDSETENLQLNITIDYAIKYQYTQDQYISDEIIEFFIFRTIKHLIWPYFRETVDSITSKMGLYDFILPINVSTK